MMTNIGKTKAEIILELVLALNRGDSCSVDNRVHWAERQYEEMVEQGIIVEEG
jgi:hypothetical protein